MTTAREQAEDAVEKVLNRYETTGFTTAEVADTASDVWEPLLKEAMAKLDTGNHDGHYAEHGCETCRTVLKLKEALGC